MTKLTLLNTVYDFTLNLKSTTMFLTILFIDMSALTSLYNNRICYIRWHLIVQENLRPPHTLSGSKTLSSVSRDGIQRTYLVILYLQNALWYHSSRENVVPYIPMRKLLSLFFRFSRNSQKLSKSTYRSLKVNFSQKSNKCGHSG